MFFFLVFVMPLCASMFFCAFRSPAGKWLTSWLSFVVSNCEFVILGQMWYLIVSIPDLCILTYLHSLIFKLCIMIVFTLKNYTSYFVHN